MKYKLIETKIKNEEFSGKYDSFLISALIGVSNVLGTTNLTTYEIQIYSKLKNFIRYITFYIYIQNYKELQDIKIINVNENILNSYKSLMLKLDMIENGTDKIIFKPKYKLDKSEFDYFLNKKSQLNSNISEVVEDYFMVLNILTPKVGSKQEKLLKDKRFTYIKDIVRYLIELKEINFTSQVTPSFSEDFYTNLGELAFNLYTKGAYKNILKDKNYKSILDIGCGNGNYIDLFNVEFPSSKIIGIERQEVVFHKLLKKYVNKENIQILNEDILNVNLEQKVDLVNMSYMLFYLTHEDKRKLFSRLATLLSDDGCITICQYYPQFEAEQEIIAKYNGEWSVANRFKYEVGNSVLYAEVLLNDALSHFSQSENFNTFKNIIEDANLIITDISPADDTYYSYFITLKKRRSHLDSN